MAGCRLRSLPPAEQNSEGLGSFLNWESAKQGKAEKA